MKQIKYEPGDEIVFIYSYFDISFMSQGVVAKMRGAPNDIAYRKYYIDIRFTNEELNDENIQLDIVKTNPDMFYYIPEPCEKVKSYLEMSKVLDK